MILCLGVMGVLTLVLPYVLLQRGKWVSDTGAYTAGVILFVHVCSTAGGTEQGGRDDSISGGNTVDTGYAMRVKERGYGQASE